ncbi:helix-turn-helix transcriptional regulator [Paenirhodobacter populi]|uniref:helix-turn-helix transcriptional regulator n=1 Tax=Paenirhodobacter populi TaxID=2306993 RepID=UPI000FE2E21C|nr:helix-turn-helix transcriptional regulator [Sinirhodobacter populi]RWR09784.1 XRE family transcriptional regulator [Sinirhodobacter populi]
METPLKKFILSESMTQSSLASAVGVSRGYMSELVNGTKMPSLNLAFAIQHATKGVVPAESWSNIPQQKEAS